MGTINLFSRIIGRSFQKPNMKNVVSKSQKLLLELGFIPQFTDGIPVLTPVLKKSVKKLEKLIHKEMQELSALEISLPVLSPINLYETSGRVNFPDLFKMVVNEKKSYILNPTCEEAVVQFLKMTGNMNDATPPLRFYQISSKFRDERRSKSGLLRTKEFLMKDLYCFDENANACEGCFQEVVKRYHNFFTNLGVPYACVKGSVGEFGGLHSQEFHFLADAGEDKLIFCESCGHNENDNSIKENEEKECKNCQSKNVKIVKGIEVAHAFNLGTRFTEPFNIINNRTNELMHMGCFGIGLTRIIAASVEVLSTSKEIRWPLSLAPYLVCVIPPKMGSKEEDAAKHLSNNIYNSLDQVLNDEVIIDDRINLTVGNRFHLIQKLGFPFVVLIGKTVLDNPPSVEIHDLYDNSKHFVQVSDITQCILNRLEGSETKNRCTVKI